MHRQAIIEPVGGAEVGEAGEPMGPDDDAAMTDLRRLGQAGRSRSENPQRAIGEPDFAPLVGRERLAAQGADDRIEAPPLAPFDAVGPEFDGVAEARDRFGAIRIHDQTARFGDLQGMGERGTAKIGADERDDRAHLREPEPDREILGPVAHRESDGLAFGDARAERPARILVHPRLERAEAEGFAIAYQRGRVAISERPFGYRTRQDTQRIARRAGGRLQRPQPCAAGRISPPRYLRGGAGGGALRPTPTLFRALRRRELPP